MAGTPTELLRCLCRHIRCYIYITLGLGFNGLGFLIACYMLRVPRVLVEHFKTLSVLTVTSERLRNPKARLKEVFARLPANLHGSREVVPAWFWKNCGLL